MSDIRCPVCQCKEYTTERHVFSGGWGCLGFLLFGWIGLLLGLLGIDTYIVCLNCGHKWKPGQYQRF
ncbi:MAG: hypothetical protein WC082_08125 [Victivallales bacterium]|jgi:DNA-directed RNA polymerase subunit RPC12/RpoP